MKELGAPPRVLHRSRLRRWLPTALRRGPYFHLALVGAFTVALIVLVAPSLFPAAASPPGPPRAPPTALTPAVSTPQLQLGISANPGQICAYNASTCPAGAPTARVTLTAAAPSGGSLAWPAVQVAFVVETTLFDGVYDPNAGDPGKSCAATAGMPCEEANGVPFFVANAQKIANAIQAANPHSQVSFALVDYFATCNWDDCDGAEYHVDIPAFIPSYQFGAEVQGSFQADVLNGGWVYGDSDFSDNILHSSSITALYGTIIGSGLDWSKNTHHVIVWMGSTAPRDPEYVQNYCVSPSAAFGGGSCYGSTCEPAYTFANGQSPNCEGWVASHDGNLTHSIAALARTAPQCTESIGGVCTIDTVDLYATPTDYLSKDWPKPGGGIPPGGGPDGPLVQLDVARVLEAGCDLAAATGGTWDGPDWFTCPNGQAGTLLFEPHGPSGAPGSGTPNLNNPTLFDAFRRIGFGPVTETQVASGTGRPIFQFVAFGNIAVVPGSGLAPTANCQRYGVTLSTCQLKPSILHENGLTYLGWNWSTNRTQNVMFVGDSWSASFNIFATGPPFTTVPVDACITTYCTQAGSGPISGQYTSATYLASDNLTAVTQSFPLASVEVELTPTPAPPGAAPPPPPPAPPPIPIGPALPVAIPTSIGIGNTVGVANVSIQATAAGFIAAGLMRVGLRNRPIALRIAAKSGTIQSKFDMALSSQDAPLGRWE